jgi:hypothetical protein
MHTCKTNCPPTILLHDSLCGGNERGGNARIGQLLQLCTVRKTANQFLWREEYSDKLGSIKDWIK